MQVFCTSDEIDRGTCTNIPVEGRMWNPCYTAEVRFYIFSTCTVEKTIVYMVEIVV